MVTYEKITESRFKSLLPESPIFFLKGIADKHVKSDYMYIDTRDFNRPSRARKKNYHFYDLMLNNLESWSSFPKRNRSIIGTTSISTARSYTTNKIDDKGVFIVIPLEPKLDICICPSYDILYSFNKSVYSRSKLIDFNEEILFLCRKRSMTENEIRGMTYEGLKELVNSIKSGEISSKQKLLKAFCKSEMMFENYFSKYFDPVRHHFRLENEHLEINRLGEGKEVFASGKFIIVSFSENNNERYVKI